MKTLFAISLLAFSSVGFSTEVSMQQKELLLESLVTNISAQYVMENQLPDIVKSLKETEKSAGFSKVSSPAEIAQVLTSVLRQHDKHFAVRWTDPNAKKDVSVYEDWFAKLDRKNSGFQRVDILEGNIGYIDFWGFDTVNERSKKRAEVVMAMIADTDAIIFDLRKNGGGSADMVRLLSSYLFEQPVHLNSIYWKASDTTSEFWTFDKVNGKVQPKVPVYVLTSLDTFSAAEEFAYNLKALKRAVVVGEVTKGGANPWKFFDLEQGFQVAIPIAKAVNPITKTNWEGVGVQPDIKVSKDKALDTAYQLALKELKAKSLPVGQVKDIDKALQQFQSP